MIISTEVQDKLSPRLREVVGQLNGPGRVEASEAMGEEVRFTVVEHLRMIADTRHATAQRLGAAPSNFVAGAVDAAAAAPIRADEQGVSISMRHPVVARAFRDIPIEAKNASALTIPIHAMAYNRRAGQFPGIFRLGGRGADVGKNILAIKSGDGSVIPLFLLVRSVTQKQDRSLMPSDDEINTAAARGLTRYIRQALAKLS